MRLGTLLLLIPLSYWLINKWLAPVELREIMEKYHRLLVSKRFIAYLAGSLISSELLCVWMALLHNEIWFIDTS